MSFFIEKNEIDLGFTSIENIFLNDFMPMADGTYVKVYLMGFKFAKDNDSKLNVTNALIAKHLNIPLTDVLSAWSFWEGKGVIVKHPKPDAKNPLEDYDVEFKSLVQLYVENNYQIFMPKKPIIDKSKIDVSSSGTYKSTVDDLVAVSHNPYINNMFQKIDYIVRKNLGPRERMKILDWFNNYNVDPDIIVEAFYIAVEKRGKRSISYVDGIIKNWYDLGITSSEDLDAYMKDFDEKHLNYKTIKKSIGATNLLPSDSEKRIMSRWLEEWNFSMDVILKACERSASTTNPSINYINGILSSWKDKGIVTLEDVEREEREHLASKAAKKSPRPSSHTATKTKFHNFEQRSSKYSKEDIDKLINARQRNK